MLSAGPEASRSQHDLILPFQQVNGGSKAEMADMQPGDIISEINGENTADMLNVEAQNKIKNSKTQLQLVVERYVQICYTNKCSCFHDFMLCIGFIRLCNAVPCNRLQHTFPYEKPSFSALVPRPQLPQILFFLNDVFSFIMQTLYKQKQVIIIRGNASMYES